MQIKVTNIYVDDQEKALSFYTNVLGMAKKADFGNAGYRWLTVSFADDQNGVELQLAADTNPVGKAYQQGLYSQGQPAVMFLTSDIKDEHARITGKGGKFKMDPTDVTGSTIAQIEDGCGNLIQITQLKW